MKTGMWAQGWPGGQELVGEREVGTASKGPKFPLGKISLDFGSQCANVGVAGGIFVGSEVGC